MLLQLDGGVVLSDRAESFWLCVTVVSGVGGGVSHSAGVFVASVDFDPLPGVAIEVLRIALLVFAPCLSDASLRGPACLSLSPLVI